MNAPSSAPTLAPFDVPDVEASVATIYATDDELRLRYLNPAWHRFAAANGASWKSGAWGVGTDLMSAIPTDLKAPYKALINRALSERAVVEHEYECSSPTTFRRFRMSVYPLTNGGLLFVHKQVVSHAHGDGHAPRESLYRNDDGILVQCAHCRCCKRADDAGAWDWVPAWVDRIPAQTSHGLCPACRDFYYRE